MIDIFSFVPIPKTNQISSKVSLSGSILFIILTIAYLGTSFYLFIEKNSPKIIETDYPLPKQLYPF